MTKHLMVPVTFFMAIVVIRMLAGFAQRNSGRSVMVQGDRLVLTYGFSLRGLAVVLDVPAIGILLDCWIKYVKSVDDLVFFASMAVVFGVPTVWMTVEVFGTRCIANQDGIWKRSPWIGERFLPWRELEGISYTSTKSYRLSFTGNRSMRLAEQMDGIFELGRLIHQIKGGTFLALDEASADWVG